MGNMKANRKFVEGEDAVSAVIGVILMVAITVAIAATVYVYVSGIIGTGTGSTPTVSILASPSDEDCLITVGTPTEADIKWDDCWYNLVNITGAKTHTGFTITNGWPTGDETISGGDVIGLNPGNLHDGSKYSFTLVYNTTGGTMGTVTWTQ